MAPYCDAILFDLPHMSKPLLSAGVLAARNVVVPMEAGVFAVENLELLARFLAELATQYNTTVAIPAVLILAYPKNQMFYRGFTRQTRRTVGEWLATHLDQVPEIFVIPYVANVYHAQAAGLPMSHYAPRSRGVAAYNKVAKLFYEG